MKILLILTVCLFSSIFAEPYMAVRDGIKCSQCHFNKTGGGKRTDFGIAYSQSSLPTHFLQTQSDNNFYSSKVSDFISIGATFRLDDVRKLKYSGSLPSEKKDSTPKVKVTAPAARQTVLRQSNLFFQFDLIPQSFSFYVDYNFTTGNYRESFGMFTHSYLNSFVKAGYMLLPFGLKFMDDESFVRTGSGYNFGSTAYAIEAGIEPGPLSLVINATETAVSQTTAFSQPRWRLGFSNAYNTKKPAILPQGRVLSKYAIFGGFNIDRFTVMTEFDVIDNPPDTAKENKILNYIPVDAWFGLLSLDVLATKGINLKAVYELQQKDATVSYKKNLEARLTLGIEAFPIQFVQLALFYQINEFVPQNAAGNQDQIISRFNIAF